MGAGSATESTRAGPLACFLQQSFDGAGNGQPSLGAIFWKRPRGDRGGFWDTRRASDPSAIARLAGRGIHGVGLEYQKPATRTGALPDLPAVLGDDGGAF